MTTIKKLQILHTALSTRGFEKEAKDIKLLAKSSDKRTFSDNDKTYDVEKLWAITKDNKVDETSVKSLEKRLKDLCWGKKGSKYSAHDVLADKKKYKEDYKRILEADLEYPIMIHNGYIVDGVHRLAKAYLDKIATIKTQKISRKQMSEALMIIKKTVEKTNSNNRKD